MATNVSLMHSDIQHTGDKFFQNRWDLTCGNVKPCMTKFVSPSTSDGEGVYSVSPKNPPCGFLTIFSERLGIFNQIFTHLLYVPFDTR